MGYVPRADWRRAVSAYWPAVVARWQRHPSYWRLRAFLANLRYRITRRSFITLRSARETRLSARTGVSILGAIWKSGVSAMVVVFLLAWLSVPLSSVLSRFAVPQWLVFGHPTIPKGSAITLYSTVSQIAGIFLGLYF